MATSPSTINPATFLYEGAIFSRQNDVVTPWNTFCDEVMAKIAGTSTPGAELGDRATRKRGPSKTAQAILAVLTPEGLPKRAIITATRLSAKQVDTALSSMQKAGTAHLKGSRWFAGPGPANVRTRASATNVEQDSEAKKTVGRPRKARTSKSPSGISLSDATIKAVEACRKEGAAPETISNYLLQEFGMTVRPNHLGISLQRHKRAGRLELRDGRWYPPNVAEFRQAS